MYIRKNASFDPTLHGLIERERMTTVEAAPGQAPDPAYEPACFEQETGLSASLAAEWLARLRRKGQIVIQGPPGTGKTWVAERLGRLLVGTGRGFVDTVQFHPAYTATRISSPAWRPW